jgi:formyltetrahydrofolate-dependent phosphoribosylglycinamide formyltransferase
MATALHKKNIAIFASGTGGNANAIIEAAQQQAVHYKVALIVTNKKDAGVLQIATQHNIATLVIDKEAFFNSDIYIYVLQQHKIEFIALAGFLWKMPLAFVKAYENKIFNIHPALLPKYGGKGMYGKYVHQAVLTNKEKESGITIHYVNEVYDAGQIIFQATCTVDDKETLDTLTQKIHQLEHEYYWKILEEQIIK